MNEITAGQNEIDLFYGVAGLFAALIITLLVLALPDLIRYWRIKSM